MRKIVLVLLAVSLTVIGFVGGVGAATKLLDYGFEDWTGDADTTPHYPFVAPSLDYWEVHKSRTSVLESCNDWVPYNGSYFLYGDWYSTYDACLANDGGAPVLQLGAGWSYGNNAGFILSEKVPGDELYVKYRVRLGEGWKTNTNHYVKFFRLKWAGGGYADYFSNVIFYGGENNGMTAPGYGEGYWQHGLDLDDLGIDLSDGEWHDFAVWENISQLRGEPPGPLEVKVWVDGNLIIDREVPTNADYILEYDSVGFEGIQLLENFCGTTNDGPVTFGFDDIEIWDGLPDQSDTTPPSRSNPQPIGTLASGTTQTNISLTTNVDATCRYSNVSGTNYSDMPFNFTCTNSTNHSATVSCLENGLTYTFYVRCNSSDGYVNDDDFNITFSVDGHKADLNDDGLINMPELMVFIARWKAGDGVSRVEVEGARDIWFAGGGY